MRKLLTYLLCLTLAVATALDVDARRPRRRAKTKSPQSQTVSRKPERTARSIKAEVNEEQITAAYTNLLDKLNKSLPPYITADFKVSKTALKEYIEEKKLKPAGVEIIENWSLRMK